jgi:arylformamidase
VIHRVELVGNTSTYIDAPFHRYADERDIAGLELGALAHLPGVVVRAPVAAGRAIGRSAFAGLDVRGKAVLVHTGWDAHWRTEQYFEGHPFLTRDAAELLRDGGAALVGIDSLNIDSTDDGERPVHTILLGAGILVVEHLCDLGALPESGFRFYAVPAKLQGCGSFPVRAFGLLE